MLANNSSDFALQVIAQGSFVDAKSDPGVPYQVNVWTIQMNPAALKAWLDAQIVDDRADYETEAEWGRYLTTQINRQEAIEETLADMLGIDTDAGSLCVERVVFEIFAVVHRRQLVHFCVEWDDRKGDRQARAFDCREDAELEAAQLREMFDYVRVVPLVEGGECIDGSGGRAEFWQRVENADSLPAGRGSAGRGVNRERPILGHTSQNTNRRKFGGFYECEI